MEARERGEARRGKEWRRWSRGEERRGGGKGKG